MDIIKSINNYFLILFVGIALSGTGVCYILLDTISDVFGKYEKITKGKLKLRKEDISNEALREWFEKTSKSFKKSYIERRSLFVLTFMFFAVIVGVLLGLFHFKSVAMAVVLGFGGYIIPEQIMFYREQFRKEKILEQMAPAIRMFVAEYNDTGSEVRAIGNVGNRMPDPVGGIFKAAYKQLIAGKKVDDVLVKMSKELDNEYGRIFVQVVRLGIAGENVRDIYGGLALKALVQLDSIKKSRMTILTDRIVMVVLNIFVVVAYIFMLKQSPENYKVFTENSLGRIAVFIGAISIVGGALLDRILSKGDEEID